MNYETLKAKIKKRATKKLGNNTYLIRKEDGMLAVKFHDTEVVTWFPDGTCILDNGGWFTSTTKDRMTKYGPLQIWSEKGLWYIGEGLLYRNGMVFKDGVLLNKDAFPSQDKVESTKKKVDKMVSKYIRGFVKDIQDNGLGEPSAGDCFLCQFRAPFEDVGHLVSHMEEGYYVRSLLLTAFSEQGGNVDIRWWMARTEKDGWHVKTALRKFFRKRKIRLVQYILSCEE